MLMASCLPTTACQPRYSCILTGCLQSFTVLIEPAAMCPCRATGCCQRSDFCDPQPSPSPLASCLLICASMWGTKH